MPVWNIVAVNKRPGCTLSPWSVVALPNGDRHLVGYSVDGNEGRVSTCVAEFDPAALLAVSASGRTYELHGEPRWQSDAAYTWEKWCLVNSVESWVDVSAEVWVAHIEAAKRT